jgi:hypothetical protein
MLLSIPLALTLTGICYQIWFTEFRTPTGPGRWHSESPDGRFTVTGYSNKGLRSLIPTMTMPGDGGGWGPGTIILRDKKTEEILQQVKVEELGGMDEGNVEWWIGDPDAVWRKGCPTATGALREGDYFRIKFVGTWPLPSLDGKLPPPLE